MAGKKQHFVPRYYLKGFADNAKLYVYDIWKDEKVVDQNVDISDVGFKKNFYNLNLEQINIFLSEKITDKAELDNILEQYNERWSANLIRSFQDLDDRIGIIKNLGDYTSKVNMPDLYDFIVIQMLRTPRFRKGISDISKLVRDKVNDMTEVQIDGETKQDSMSIDDISKLIHTNLLLSSIAETKIGKTLKFKNPFLAQHHFQSDLTKSIYKWLKNSIGILYMNITDTLFKTSDSPVSFTQAHGTDVFSMRHLYIPITKRCAFLFLNPIWYPSASIYHRKLRILQDGDEELAMNFNFYVINKCDKHLYSFDDHFSWESLFIKKEIPIYMKVW